MDRAQFFLEAKTSARERIMQFTAISGIKIPRFAEKEGKNVSSNIFIIETRPAIIMTDEKKRIFSGIMEESKEIINSENIKTKHVQTPITIAFITVVVVAKTGHMLRSITKTELFFIIPFERMFALLSICFSLRFY